MLPKQKSEPKSTIISKIKSNSKPRGDHAHLSHLPILENNQNKIASKKTETPVICPSNAMPKLIMATFQDKFGTIGALLKIEPTIET